MIEITDGVWAVQGLDWEFAVINSDTANAFVVPGYGLLHYTLLNACINTHIPHAMVWLSPKGLDFRLKGP